MISNVVAALKSRYPTTEFTKRTGENIICKVYRIHTKNKSDGKLFDILIPYQNIYSVQGNYVRVMSWDGKSNTKLKGSLLSSIPFGGSYISYKNYFPNSRRIGLDGNRQRVRLVLIFWMEFLIRLEATLRNSLSKLLNNVQGMPGYQTSSWIQTRAYLLQIFFITVVLWL